MTVPDGFIIGDCVVWHQGNFPMFVSAGFRWQAPDRAYAPDHFLTEMRERLRVILRSLTADMRAQACWHVTSNYNDELATYARDTEQLADNKLVQEHRDRVFARFLGLMEKRILRKEVSLLFVSKKITAKPPHALKQRVVKDHYSKLFAELDREFSIWQESVNAQLEPIGCSLGRLSRSELADHYDTFFNPSNNERANHSTSFDFNQSLWDNCQKSEVFAEPKEPFSFSYGFCWHSILGFKRWPDVTDERSILHLTQSGLKDFAIRANIYPQDIDRAVKREQSDLDRLKGDYASEQKEEFVTSIKLKKQRIEDLKSGSMTPFMMDYFIHAWDNNKDELVAKTKILAQKIDGISGAKHFAPMTPVTTRSLWLQSFPGFPWGSYMHHAKYCVDTQVAHLMPVSTNYCGWGKGEALYDGANRTMAGMNTFIDGQPQHAIVWGAAGAGKSTLISDLLLQTDPFYSYTFIIGSGRDYKRLCGELGYPMLEIKPNSKMCLNYFDTLGQPLTPDIKNSAVSFAAKLAGRLTDETQQIFREAVISSYVNQVYEEQWEFWSRGNPEIAEQITRTACALDTHKANFAVDTALDAFFIVRDNPDHPAFKKAMDDTPASKAARWAQEGQHHAAITALGYSAMPPDAMPVHSLLAEVMKMTPRPDHDPRQVRDLATLLEMWCAHEGPRGALFDGITNTSLSSRYTYIDLTELGEADSTLKEVAFFLVFNQARKEIVRRPVHERKRVILEEAALIMKMPSGERLIEEFYAQMRKFKCWPVTIFQQYAQIKQSKAKDIITGNAKMVLVSRQKSPDDLAGIAHEFDLPEPARHAIRHYPMPKPGITPAAFCYWHEHHPAPHCGTIYNVTLSDKTTPTPQEKTEKS